MADGAETQQEAAILSKMGAECLQSYLYGVPKFDPY